MLSVSGTRVVRGALGVVRGGSGDKEHELTAGFHCSETSRIGRVCSSSWDEVVLSG
jgi:hypothetical protein